MALLIPLLASGQTSITTGQAGYESHVRPFFQKHCVKCHSPTKTKGNINVHALNGDLAAGRELETWESIVEKSEFGEMTPIQEQQPQHAEVQKVIQRIETEMWAQIQNAPQMASAPRTRRLTNVEFQNTLNELLGFELDVIDDLPEDPELDYGFNNTAGLMRMGPSSWIAIWRRAKPCVPRSLPPRSLNRIGSGSSGRALAETAGWLWMNWESGAIVEGQLPGA